MDHLENITVEELRTALENVEGKTPTKRLLAAIAYKNGITQTELADWYGVERRTIYSWLTRLEDESLEDAVTDAERPGRPRKLEDDERQAFERTLQEPPTAAGYDESAWSPALVQTHLEEAYDATYSIPSCRRLMKEAGLRYHARRTETPADGADQSAQDGRGDRTGRWAPR
ncbi:helix-turn-helix domain-containing protein [Salinadaptatus halalkaliphilus]|uniref:Helix-turn-helix domain-containing protein n=1 Tax=Salinadaptatus halalkaliphilus TaxID=2419781 RepID=A0A4S3TRY4_9EURY|nr:helix-turn-helix domain-containing protein [Salinadaptatus halalkaliphilus]